MIENFQLMLNNFYENNIAEYFASLQQYPIKLVTLIVDLGIVIFLGYKLLQVAKDTRAWQLLKGIVFLIIVTALSGLLKLNILHYTFIINDIWSLAFNCGVPARIKKGIRAIGN